MCQGRDVLAVRPESTEAAGAAIISLSWHRSLLCLDKETSCPWGTMVPLQCVCLCVLFMQKRGESCPSSVLTPSMVQKLYMCLCNEWHPLQQLNGPRHPGGFPRCYQRDMGGLHCMNNTPSTLDYVLSGIHPLTECDRRPTMAGTDAKALLYATDFRICEWMDFKPVMQIPWTWNIKQKYFTKKYILDPFMFDTTIV